MAAASPNGKWVAVQESRHGGASRVWLVGIDDGTCREVVDGQTYLPCSGLDQGDAWSTTSMLRVRTTSFSLVRGPYFSEELDIEPTHLDVAEHRFLPHVAARTSHWTKPSWAHLTWTSQQGPSGVMTYEVRWGGLTKSI